MTLKKVLKLFSFFSCVLFALTQKEPKDQERAMAPPARSGPRTRVTLITSFILLYDYSTIVLW